MCYIARNNIIRLLVRNSTSQYSLIPIHYNTTVVNCTIENDNSPIDTVL